MTFENAMAYTKKGNKMFRTGWNGKKQWVALQRPDENSKMTLPYLYIYTVHGHLVPWIASQTDILNDDWEVML